MNFENLSRIVAGVAIAGMFGIFKYVRSCDKISQADEARRLKQEEPQPDALNDDCVYGGRERYL